MHPLWVSLSRNLDYVYTMMIRRPTLFKLVNTTHGCDKVILLAVDATVNYIKSTTGIPRLLDLFIISWLSCSFRTLLSRASRDDRWSREHSDRNHVP
jgi:hypothetical protein